MAMQALRDGAAGGFLKYILLGLLGLACGGLVMMDMGGFFRGGVTSTDAAKVGGQSIQINSFDRKLRRSLTQLGVSPQEAYRLGYVNQFLATEIRTRLVQQAARDAGLMIGRKQIAHQIRDLIEPMVQQGAHPQDVLNQLLLNQGMSEGELVAALSNDMAGGILTAALQSGFATSSDAMAGDLYLYQNEQRTIEYIPFLSNDLKDLNDPTDEQLQSFYESTKENYAQAELRTFRLLKIQNEELRKTLDISEEEIRNIYDSNVDMYAIEQQWTLDQALVDTEDQAQKITEQAKNSKNLEKAVQNVTGKKTGYLGEQAFTEDGLLEAIKDEVKDAEKSGQIIGPVQTPLGWQVVLVKNIREAGMLGYEEVKDQIRKEEEENMLIDEQYALANIVDDMLAGGASVQEVKDETPIAILDLPPINQFGQDEKGKNALIKDYEPLSGTILETGFELEEGETSPVMEMPDGSFMAIHLSNLKPKTYRSFDDVKDEIATQWKNDQKEMLNRMQTTARLAALNAGDLSLRELAKNLNTHVKTVKNISRTDDPKKPLTTRSLYNLFELPPDQHAVIEIEDGVAIARVSDFKLPETVKTDSQDYENIKNSLVNNEKNEALILYVESKNQEYGASINEALLERIYDEDSGSY